MFSLDFFKKNSQIKIDRQTSPTICPLPFISTYGTASGDLVACCESQETKMSNPAAQFADSWNGNHYKSLRKQLMAGQKPELCKKCWRNEDEGLFSNREQSLKDLEEGFYETDEIFCRADGSVEKTPAFLEIKASNVCNLKCRMCHPESSHRIIEDKEIIEKYRSGLPWNNKPLRATQLFEQFKDMGDPFFSDIRVLQYSGGEPLISAEQFEFTSSLADRHGENIQLRYSTNLNNLKFEQYDVIELWKKFKHVNVKVSADGVGDVYNYIRMGGNFDVLKRNLDRLMSANLNNVDIGIGFTTQSYNIFQLPEVLDFFTQYTERNRISTHLLYTPRLMCPDYLPIEIKEKTINKLQKSSWDFSDKIKYLQSSIENQPSDRLWKTLLNYTEEMEKKYNLENGFRSLLKKYLDI